MQGQATSTLLIVLVLIFDLTFSKRRSFWQSGGHQEFSVATALAIFSLKPLFTLDLNSFRPVYPGP